CGMSVKKKSPRGESRSARVKRSSDNGKIGPVPGLGGVLEAAVYVSDLEAARRFYGNVLGLPGIFSVPGRQLVFRCQQSGLLVFNPLQTEREQIIIKGGAIPLHGTHGAGHVAFRVAKTQMEAWRRHFRAAGVSIESEVVWPNGAHSIYFRD